MEELLQFLAEAKISGLEDEEAYFAEPVEPSDQIVGVLPIRFRAYFNALMEKKTEMMTKCEMLGCDDYEDLIEKLEDCETWQEDRVKAVMGSMDFFESLEDLFWAQVALEFPDLIGNFNDTCIREGWKITILEDHDEDEIKEDYKCDEDDDHDSGHEPKPKPKPLRPLDPFLEDLLNGRL